MDPRLHNISTTEGAFLTREARALGYDDKAIARAVRTKEWHRIRRGAYTMGSIWAAASPEQRHVIHTFAVVRSLGDRVAVSHVSNLVLRGVATWGADFSRVHVTRLDGGAGRTERDLVHHEGLVEDQELERFDGVLMTSAPRAVLESLTLMDVERGLVVADSALHQGIVSPDELAYAHTRIREWPNVRTGQLVVRMARAGAASPGESRVRYACWEQGLPEPTLQYPVRDADGLIGFADLAFEHQRVLVEFDGKVKYGRLLKPGQSPGDVVFEEKCREDRLRAAGWIVVRFTWADLAQPTVLASRIRAAFRVAAA